MSEIPLFTRFKNAWNVFSNKDPTPSYGNSVGYYGMSNPARSSRTIGTTASILDAIYNHIAVDVSALDVRHVEVDLNKNRRYKGDIDSKLNYCLSSQANMDQTGRAFLLDIVLTMFDKGVVAAVPVETTNNMLISDNYDILAVRTGRIIEWRNDRVKVSLYDQNDGTHKEIWVLKRNACIFENPFYSVMNAPNSVAQRLSRKLTLLDQIDEQTGSGRFNIIVRLPYGIRGELKEKQAEKRRKDIEDQLANSRYGIAYIDGTEQITELNRGIENNLMEQIEYLTRMLYSQLGVTDEIMNGTANESTMANYFSRICVPIITTIVEEMRIKWLSPDARERGQTIMWFQDPFKSVPTSKLGDMGDKLTRNEIVSSNEIRGAIGMKPSSDPNADKLRNKNISQSNDSQTSEDTIFKSKKEENQNEV